MLERLTQHSAISIEELLESMLKATSNGILCFETVRDDAGEVRDFRCVFINDIGAQALGGDVEAFLGVNMSALEVFHPIEQFAGQLKQVLADGRLLTFEHLAESSQRYFRVTAVRIRDGVTLNMQDITVLREVQQEMETEEIKYRRLFEESIDAICLIDEHFNIREANSSCLDMLHYTWQDLHCISLSDLVGDEAAFDLFRKTLATKGKVEEFELSLQTKSGKAKPSLLNGVVIEDDQGHPLYLLVIRDLTKRKQTERDLLRAEKLSMTGKIARTIAHEVRNPLTNLTLVIDQLKDEVAEHSEDADMYFEIIDRNIDRIGKLIADLLNSSKPRALTLVQQSLNKLVMEALDLVRDRITLREMSLVLSLTEEPNELPLDADQFKVALLNLLINAIEAMEVGKGQLLVTTECLEDQVLLSIQDNGVGMSDDELNQLFEPYFTGKKQGTGLGLTTVQNIIHSHHGRINVDSEVGAGTTFSITFPIAKV